MFGRKEKPLSYREETAINLDATMARDSALPRGDENLNDVGTEFFLAEDEKILEMFDSGSPNFVPWLEPYKPWASRILSLTNLGTKDLRRVKGKISLQMMRLKYRRNGFYEKALVTSLENFLLARVNGAENGWLLSKLTDKSRTVTVRNDMREQKRRLF